MPVERTKGHHIHPCHREGDVVSLDLLDWCRSHTTAGYVRLTPVEYVNITGAADVITHFNLSPCNFEPGRDYAALLIMQNGRYTPGTDIKPTVRLHPWIRLNCLSTENDVSQTDLPPDCLTGNDLGMASLYEVIAAVWNKYHLSLPDLSYPDFQQTRLCVTRFRTVSVETAVL